MAGTTRSNVVWFDVPVVDLDRAIAFYKGVLASEVTKHEFPGGKLGVFTHADGVIGGCLVLDQGKPSASGPVLYFNCAGRLDEAAALVPKLGGSVVRPRYAIGPHGFCVMVLDSEGNRVALHSS